MIDLDTRITVNTFQNTIELCVHKKKMGYLEAIMWYCEQHQVEIEAIAGLIKKSEVVKTKLEAECEDANMLQKQPRLPI